MLTVSQFTEGVLGYLEKEVLIVMDGWQVWVAGAAVVLLKKRADSLLPAIAENKLIKALGIISDSGLIDLDELYAALKTAAQTHGAIKMDLGTFGNFTFSETDINALYRHLKKLPAAKVPEIIEEKAEPEEGGGE